MQPLLVTRLFNLLVGVLWVVIAPRVFAQADKQSSDTLPTERQAIACDPNKPDYRACIHQHFKKDIYTKSAVLQCGETEMAITTSCMDTTDGTGVYCFNQTLAFLNFFKRKKIAQREGLYKTVTYSHPSDGAGEPFVTNVSCIKVGQKYYVQTINANFGNCRGCEWTDFFTNQGKYVASTGSGVYGRTSFVHKLISNKLYDRIMDGEWVEQEDGEISIDIFRTRD